MTNETLETQDESRISRRNALKAAVGVGVGAVAWSGPQITSFGATPAYAAGCTFIEEWDFYGGWKATNQRSDCQAPTAGNFNLAYNSPTTDPPEGFGFEPAYGFPQGNALCAGEEIRIIWPDDRDLDCYLTLRFRSPAGQDKTPYYERTFGPDAHTYCSDAPDNTDCYDSLHVVTPTGAEVGAPSAYNPGGIDPAESHQYSIVLYCFSEGAGSECVDPPEPVSE